MWYIKTKRYPVEGFNAITHWPFVFYKRDDKVMRNHEGIHGGQQLPLAIITQIVYFGLSLHFGILDIYIISLVVFGLSLWTFATKLFLPLAVVMCIWFGLLFYLIYFIEWIFKGYRGISFEREAYKNQHNNNYKRKLFGWLPYLKKS